MIRDAISNAELERRRHEHRKVKLLLQSQGLEGLRNTLMDQNDRQFVGKWLTFRLFHNEVVDFPIHLHFRLLFKLDRDQSCSMKALFLKLKEGPSGIIVGRDRVHRSKSRSLF